MSFEIKRALMIGPKSSAVDFQKWPQLSADKLETACVQIRKEVQDAGYDCNWCLLDARRGAGVRTVPDQNKTNDMHIKREELNDTNFGLACSMHSRRNAAIGVTVNLPTGETDYRVHFGDRGDSSYGPREQGKAAAEFSTTVRNASICTGVHS